MSLIQYWVKYKKTNLADAIVYSIDIRAKDIVDAEAQSIAKIGSAAQIISITENIPLPEPTTVKILIGLAAGTLLLSLFALAKGLKN